MTEADRIRVREARDTEQRRLVDEAGGMSVRGPREQKSPVVRAAEKAHRAQDAVAIVATLIPDTEEPAPTRCCYCGTKLNEVGVCIAHRDLVEGF